MSRSQKDARRATSAKKAPESSGAPSYPDVTQKDGSENIAGTVNRVSTDEYTPAPFPTRNV